MQRRQLVDIGANLTDGMFSGVYFGKGRHAADVATVVQRAWDSGVSRVVVTAGSLEDVTSSVRLAREGHGLCPLRVYSTVGVHPTRCTSFAEEGEEAVFAGLLGALRDPEARPYIAALGEMGLGA